MAIFSLTNIAVAFAGLVVARHLYWEATVGARQRALSKQHGCVPPTPRRKRIFPSFMPDFGLDFVICNFFDLKSHRLLSQWTADLEHSNSPVLFTNIFGMKIFITNDPENVKTMLATNFDTWSLGKERIDHISSIVGHGIFTNEGKAWKHSRDMLRPCFEKTAVADVSKLERHCEMLFKLLPTNGDEVDLQPLLHELTLDIATEFLFGRSTNSLARKEANEDVKEFITAFEYCMDPLANENFKTFGYPGLFLPDKRKKRSVKAIQDFADKVIDEQLALKAKKDAVSEKDDKNRYILLDELVTATSDRQVIRSELLHILIAGRDTTASLLSNTIWELARQPDTAARLRREIIDIIGDQDNTPSYDQLKEMKYLRAIINETQRLYPVVPSNSRQALQDTILPHGTNNSPIFIPKGAYVAFHPWSINRRTSLFGANAAAFNPDRWLDPNFRPGWAYTPFSGGPRVCIGQNFALTEVMFVVVRLLQRFQIEQRDFEDWREKLTMTCIGAGGCKVGLTRRGE